VSDVRNATASFFDLYARGEVSEDAIDDFVDAWHEGAGAEDVPLSAFLGMTGDEYAVWVMDARALPVILEARRTNQDLREMVRGYVAGMQAEGQTADGSVIHALSHWLARKGGA
jgi:hypothetical protein